MHSRRRVLGLLLASGLSLLGGAWTRLGGERRARSGPRRLVVSIPPGDGVTAHGDVLLVRRGAELRAFSSRCPHLGCRLDRVVGTELVCPCHGSRFDLAGRRLAGPAATDLIPLGFERLADGRIDVVLPG